MQRESPGDAERPGAGERNNLQAATPTGAKTLAIEHELPPNRQGPPVDDSLVAAIEEAPEAQAQSPHQAQVLGSKWAAAPANARTDDSSSSASQQGRPRGYQNIMVAGAMTATLMCGLALLIITVAVVIPQVQSSPPTPEPVLYTAILWCPPCQQAGSQVILWEKAGDGVSRGAQVGQLPHDTQVSVIAEMWSEPEERTYFHVTAQGQKGWVPETFIKALPAETQP
jgi:hypothetical protein